MEDKTITQGQFDVLISYLGPIDIDTLSFEGKEIFVKAWNYVVHTKDISKVQQLHRLIGRKVVKCVEYMNDYGYTTYPPDYENTDELFGAVCGLFEEVIET